ncbi:MAG: hypothetical protein Q4D20_11275 [Clostridia bacterium]|nr:hypothetical protein [Clostridia bacterium]
MKKIVSIALILILCFGMAGCAKTYHGTDELLKKAREELPISEADTTDIQYAGMCKKENTALAWFISGNEYQKHYYLPMEIEIKNNGEDYTFVHTYKPVTDKCPDVATVNWQEGYAFLINNPKVSTVKITLENGEQIRKIVQKDSVPYSFYVPSALSEYVFLDADGKEVQ